jgi:hypothetical protein
MRFFSDVEETPEACNPVQGVMGFVLCAAMSGLEDFYNPWKRVSLYAVEPVLKRCGRVVILHPCFSWHEVRRFALMRCGRVVAYVAFLPP